MRISLLRKKPPQVVWTNEIPNFSRWISMFNAKHDHTEEAFLFLSKEPKTRTTKKGADTHKQIERYYIDESYIQKKTWASSPIVFMLAKFYNGAAPNDHTYNYTIPSSTWFALCPCPPPPQHLGKKKSLDDPQISLKCCTPNPFPKNSPPISWRWHAIIPWQQSPMMGRFVQVSIWEFDPIYLPQRLELLHTSVRHDDVGGCIVGVENNVNMQLVCKHASKYRKYIAFTIYVIYNIHN